MMLEFSDIEIVLFLSLVLILIRAIDYKFTQYDNLEKNKNNKKKR